ncbi:putative myosin-binding protein [Dioscorea sansibarensis]
MCCISACSFNFIYCEESKFVQFRRISQGFVGMAEKNYTRHFCSALSSAFLEWLLMLLLLLDVLIQYIGSKLARFCKLQMPCLLCSRIDRIFGNAKAEFFGDLICDDHKMEISSLVYCDTHEKLADVHGMCQACFPVFANGKKINSVVYNSSMNFEHNDGACLQRKSYEDDIVYSERSQRTRHCSCCSEPFKNKSHLDGMRGKCNFGNDVARVGFSSGFRSLHHSGKLGTDDRLSHVGYCGLKDASDSDVDFAYSDDEHGNVIVLGTDTTNKGVTLTDFSNEMIQEKLIQTEPMIPELSFSVCEKELLPVVSNDSVAKSLEELECVQVKSMTNGPSSSELISEQIPTEVSNPKGSLGDGPNFSSSGEANKTLIPDGNLKASQLLNDTLPTATNASKLDFGLKGSLLSPRFAEIVSRRCGNRVPDDLKSVQQQLPNSRGLEFSWNDFVSSPRVPGQIDDFKPSDCSNSIIMQNITAKRLSADRIETASECSDVSTVHRFFGETNFDQLKQQAELDMDFVKILYKELEEERSASAISANQAMNMINRLQEEKAAMQMEALQYLRMMEEQAEYDQEALQNANELLTQREKEIQDLEAVVESYRRRYGDEPLSEIVPELLNDLQEREACQS